MGTFSPSSLAIPAVVLLISFLSFTSQILFAYIDPHPLRHNESITFNVLIACIFVTYFRACFTDPGRIPKDWRETLFRKRKSVEAERSEGNGALAIDGCDPDKRLGEYGAKERWCRKCDAAKPPRAHHCKSCKRCIPRMDHHCPWTASCVSHANLPHFMRFLFYAVVTMMYLQSLLWKRLVLLWARRHFASTLGPTAPQLLHLFALTLTNSFTLLILTILLVRNIYGLALNTTTIEFWEIERHEAVLRRQRAKRRAGEQIDRDGRQMTVIVKQEFPYDVGIWRNLKAGMGGGWNVLLWFWPFAATPSLASGLEFETNGLEDPHLPWPPPDPDRAPRGIWPASIYANGNTGTHLSHTPMASMPNAPHDYSADTGGNHHDYYRDLHKNSSTLLRTRLNVDIYDRHRNPDMAIASDLPANEEAERITSFEPHRSQTQMAFSSALRQRTKRQYDDSANVKVDFKTRTDINTIGGGIANAYDELETGSGDGVAAVSGAEAVATATSFAGTAGNAHESREQWRNAEGERLADFGVDEEEDGEDEDEDEDENVPLGVILRRQRESLSKQ